MNGNKYNFDEYVRLGEPGKKERTQNWQIAIGLQQVDGLTPSEYLIDVARRNIEGDITIDEANKEIDSYYKQADKRGHGAARTEEADKVSARISSILSSDAFTFSVPGFLSIHRQLFNGLFEFAGRIRDYNISKDEWVLDGKSVLYSNALDIKAALDYDFEREKQFDYGALDTRASVKHIVKFVSDIWQIHAFGEGNTRAIAVFAIKYLRSIGFGIDNELFEKHSWYFRNALVRANYNDMVSGIKATDSYLMAFFGNLIFGEKNELKNRFLHIKWPEPQCVASEQNSESKCNICTLGCTLEEAAVLEFLKGHPTATQKEVAMQIKKSERTVKTITVNLQDKGLLKRTGGRRNGAWEVTAQNISSAPIFAASIPCSRCPV
jgi:fido (protein-threonine AMPylation protein)